MNLQFMRNVDQYVGGVACLLLRLAVFIKHRFLPPGRLGSNERVRTILVQKYFGLGSLLHAIPLIRGLRERFPNAQIILVTFKPLDEVSRICEVADEIVVLNSKSFLFFIAKTTQLIFSFQRNKPDISIDLEFFSNFSLILSVLSRATVRIGLFQKKVRPSLLMTHPLNYNHYKHLKDIYFAFGELLNVERRDCYFQNILPAPIAGSGSAVRLRLGLSDQLPLVLVNPNASNAMPQRRWPADNFAELTRLLIESFPGFQYAVIGSIAEIDTVASFMSALGGRADKVVNLSGKTTLVDLFSLIHESYLLITNDSGPMHVASLYGKNLAAIFGPETPIVYGPVNKNSIVFFAGKLYCSPCLNVYDGKTVSLSGNCHDYRCLKQISPSEVFRGVSEVFLDAG